MKAKITGIILLFVLIAPVAVTFSWLQMEKAQVRRAAKWHILNHTEKSELTFLQFSQEQSQSDLNWKHNREFEWQGKMYDIVSQESKGDSIYYWCFADDEEDKINRKISSFLSDSWQDNPNKKEQEKRLQTFFKSLFIGDDMARTNIRASLQKQNFHTFKAGVKCIFINPPTPPPQA